MATNNTELNFDEIAAAEIAGYKVTKTLVKLPTAKKTCY